MRKLFTAAALAALLPGMVLAQTYTYSPGQAGAVGSIVSATDTQGNTRRVVLPSVNLGGTGTSASQVQGTSANGATDDGSNPVKVGGVYNSTLPTITSGWRGNLQLNASGALITAIASNNVAADSVSNSSVLGPFSTIGSVNGGLITAAINYNGSTWDRTRSINGALAAGNTGTGTAATERGGYSFSEITTAASTSVKASAGILHYVSINTCVASATVKIYNALSATGTPITITCPSTVGNPIHLDYDAYFGTGIFVVTSGATDVTVGYR